MGTEVLRPQHCLVERVRSPPAAFSRRRAYNYSNYNNNNYNNIPAAGSGRNYRRPATRPERSEQRKRVERKASSDDSRMTRNTGLVMEKVTILRRGKSLDSLIKGEALRKEGDDLVVVGTQRLGPDPEMVPKQIGIVPGTGPDVYAGSAFAVSPSPSALPFPSFGRKQPSLAVDDSATRDLRRLLRLE